MYIAQAQVKTMQCFQQSVLSGGTADRSKRVLKILVVESKRALRKRFRGFLRKRFRGFKRDPREGGKWGQQGGQMREEAGNRGCKAGWGQEEQIAKGQAGMRGGRGGRADRFAKQCRQGGLQGTRPDLSLQHSTALGVVNST